ncbi:MAG TPA: glycoside hydrolase family 38 C-terminal domain-containing protein [Cytophagales bacterium]|nr:glycoside hydrolase family 38 C-terminal domain-containing protein [Cytophagales bacterium]
MWIYLKKHCYFVFVILFIIGNVVPLNAQTAYFVDGYHGGVYGHYPKWKTQFIVDQLRKNPEWKINLEIEPETWDSVKVYNPDAYNEFKQALTDPFFRDRIEFVNPAYGQSYLFNTSGESVIRQFSYGIDKIKSHFPSVNFLTYSTEEPCFTSALPQILNSFGFKYAVLKNPNTCWGGYTRAFGGEKINWIGPDQSSITTVPRYAVEALEEGSTWQTTAWANAEEYVDACLQAGISHPVGMCLQDAGWKGGPWLGIVKNTYQPSVYTLWRDYFGKVSASNPTESWKFSQEDILVSLVWGSQILQKLAQQVRAAENKIVVAEKIAAMNAFYNGSSYPSLEFDRAWRTLLLAQHHDCWIVPYNGKPGDTWADKTKDWTDFTNLKSDSIISRSLPNFVGENENIKGKFIRVVNTTASSRKGVVSVPLPYDADGNSLGIQDEKGTWIKSQLVTDESKQRKELLFISDVPSVGYNTYQIKEIKKRSSKKSASVESKKDNTYLIETKLYQILLDASHGGIIKSLKAKSLKNKDFVDSSNDRSFNEIRGFFYDENKFISSKDYPAHVRIIENGPIRTKVNIEGKIGEHPFKQTITLYENDPKIDFDLTIDWNGNPGIGKYSQAKNYKSEDPEKAFYNDQYKLLALFPFNVQSPKVYKNAPFDVTESRLKNTFFNRWDSIKNNIILNWVDVEDASAGYGMSLFTDHTTSYAFDGNNTLGLTLQYSGTALWGRDYKITGPSHIKFALLPHAGKWDVAAVSSASSQWNEPLVTGISGERPENWSRSFLSLSRKGWEISALQMEGQDVLLRLFNAADDDTSGEIIMDGLVSKAESIELNGKMTKELAVSQSNGKSKMTLSMPRFGIRTIKIKITK